MIGNYKYWINLRVEDGKLKGVALASAQYTDQRSASVSIDLPDELLQTLEPQLFELLEGCKGQLQLKATLAAAEALTFAAKQGEIGGLNG